MTVQSPHTAGTGYRRAIPDAAISQALDNSYFEYAVATQ